MSIDTLADLLKRRGCRSVRYFHTDHFEPWSTSIDETSARAVERMAEQARKSPYARRLSLFYSVFVPYRLASDGMGPADRRVGTDGVVFVARSEKQEALARSVIRPLVEADGHEMHLHVHHEFWTQNSSHFDTPVSRWVNESSSAEADAARLDLNFQLCRETISREIGKPFDRWAFIHGNWALNASDTSICRVTNEIAMIMRHGGFGDFSFPAGRSYCDPKLEAPFTCLPVDVAKAYDDPRADAKPIARGSRIMRPGRFFIWNSQIKSTFSSLDYYSAANRKLFETPERVVAEWLSKSVCLGEDLFIKTHAHTMKSDYRLTQPDGLIPHCNADVIAVFDMLLRVCDRAGVEFALQTVNEVVDRFSAFDGAAQIASARAEPISRAAPRVLQDRPEATPAPPSASPSVVMDELRDLHRTWMATDAARLRLDRLYQGKVDGRHTLEEYEIELAAEIGKRYPAGRTRIFEIGTGWGGIAILLARMGYEVVGFEGNLRRHAGCRWHFEEQIRQFPTLAGRLSLAEPGLFPEAFSPDALSADKINLCIATNITNSYTAEHEQDIVKAAASFQELILDLGRFGRPRNSQEDRDNLLAMLESSAFRPLERLVYQAPYEYWRLQSTAMSGTPRAARDLPPAPKTLESSTQTVDSSAPVNPPVHFADVPRLFTVFGDRRLTRCPVCRSSAIAPLWRMPMTSLKQPIDAFGNRFGHIPMLRVPTKLYCFDFCDTCETIFLNPVHGGRKQDLRKADRHIAGTQDPAAPHDHETVCESFVRWIPDNATVMLDAACGAGQYLQMIRSRTSQRWSRLIGLDLSEKYVKHVAGQGIEAHVFDIDDDDLFRIVPARNVDFISFLDGFRLVERPLDALAKLLGVLRPGGRLFFTARRYGADVQSTVEPDEPFYIGDTVVSELPGRLGCRLVDNVLSDTRYYLVLEK